MTLLIIAIAALAVAVIMNCRSIHAMKRKASLKASCPPLIRAITATASDEKAITAEM